MRIRAPTNRIPEWMDKILDGPHLKNFVSEGLGLSNWDRKALRSEAEKRLLWEFKDEIRIEKDAYKKWNSFAAALNKQILSKTKGGKIKSTPRYKRIISDDEFNDYFEEIRLGNEDEEGRLITPTDIMLYLYPDLGKAYHRINPKDYLYDNGEFRFDILEAEVKNSDDRVDDDDPSKKAVLKYLAGNRFVPIVYGRLSPTELRYADFIKTDNKGDTLRDHVNRIIDSHYAEYQDGHFFIDPSTYDDDVTAEMLDTAVKSTPSQRNADGKIFYTAEQRKIKNTWNKHEIGKEYKAQLDKSLKGVKLGDLKKQNPIKAYLTEMKCMENAVKKVLGNDVDFMKKVGDLWSVEKSISKPEVGEPILGSDGKVYRYTEDMTPYVTGSKFQVTTYAHEHDGKKPKLVNSKAEQKFRAEWDANEQKKAEAAERRKAKQGTGPRTGKGQKNTFKYDSAAHEKDLLRYIKKLGLGSSLPADINKFLEYDNGGFAKWLEKNGSSANKTNIDSPYSGYVPNEDYDWTVFKGKHKTLNDLDKYFDKKGIPPEQRIKLLLEKGIIKEVEDDPADAIFNLGPGGAADTEESEVEEEPEVEKEPEVKKPSGKLPWYWKDNVLNNLRGLSELVESNPKWKEVYYDPNLLHAIANYFTKYGKDSDFVANLPSGRPGTKEINEYIKNNIGGGMPPVKTLMHTNGKTYYVPVKNYPGGIKIKLKDGIEGFRPTHEVYDLVKLGFNPDNLIEHVLGSGRGYGKEKGWLEMGDLKNYTDENGKPLNFKATSPKTKTTETETSEEEAPKTRGRRGASKKKTTETEESTEEPPKTETKKLPIKDFVNNRMKNSKGTKKSASVLSTEEMYSALRSMDKDNAMCTVRFAKACDSIYSHIKNMSDQTTAKIVKSCGEKSVERLVASFVKSKFMRDGIELPDTHSDSKAVSDFKKSMSDLRKSNPKAFSILKSCARLAADREAFEKILGHK